MLSQPKKKKKQPEKTHPSLFREPAQDPEVKYAGEIFYATVVRSFFFRFCFLPRERGRGRVRTGSSLLKPFLLLSLTPPPFPSFPPTTSPHITAGPVPHPVDAGLVEEDAPALLRAGVAAGAVVGPGGDLGKVSIVFFPPFFRFRKKGKGKKKSTRWEKNSFSLSFSPCSFLSLTLPLSLSHHHHHHHYHHHHHHQQKQNKGSASGASSAPGPSTPSPPDT